MDWLEIIFTCFCKIQPTPSLQSNVLKLFPLYNEICFLKKKKTILTYVGCLHTVARKRHLCRLISIFDKIYLEPPLKNMKAIGHFDRFPGKYRKLFVRTICFAVLCCDIFCSSIHLFSLCGLRGARVGDMANLDLEPGKQEVQTLSGVSTYHFSDISGK